MNLPEDRHPLLYVYVENEQPERVRSRCLSQGATLLLGKWPDHVTFSWMMAVAGFFTLLTCFLLTIILFIVSSTGHQHERRSLIGKCERNEHVIQLVHMKNIEDLTVNENATYFVEIFTNETNSRDSACSVESYLKQTSSPVFLVSIHPNKSMKNSTISDELEKKFANFKTIKFDFSSFFDKTVFANFQTQDIKFLTFLAKVLISWNVGGTVIDSKAKTLRELSGVLTKDMNATIGSFQEDIVLISSKRFCHVFIFDILKTIIETKNILQFSQLSLTRMAQERFCHGRKKCDGIEFLPSSKICASNEVNDDCIFMMPEINKSKPDVSNNFTWERLCPFVKAAV